MTELIGHQGRSSDDVSEHDAAGSKAAPNLRTSGRPSALPAPPLRRRVAAVVFGALPRWQRWGWLLSSLLVPLLAVAYFAFSVYQFAPRSVPIEPLQSLENGGFFLPDGSLVLPPPLSPDDFAPPRDPNDVQRPRYRLLDATPARLQRLDEAAGRSLAFESDRARTRAAETIRLLPRLFDSYRWVDASDPGRITVLVGRYVQEPSLWYGAGYFSLLIALPLALVAGTVAVTRSLVVSLQSAPTALLPRSTRPHQVVLVIATMLPPALASSLATLFMLFGPVEFSRYEGGWVAAALAAGCLITAASACSVLMQTRLRSVWARPAAFALPLLSVFCLPILMALADSSGHPPHPGAMTVFMAAASVTLLVAALRSFATLHRGNAAYGSAGGWRVDATPEFAAPRPTGLASRTPRLPWASLNWGSPADLTAQRRSTEWVDDPRAVDRLTRAILPMGFGKWLLPLAIAAIVVSVSAVVAVAAVVSGNSFGETFRWFFRAEQAMGWAFLVLTTLFGVSGVPMQSWTMLAGFRDRLDGLPVDGVVWQRGIKRAIARTYCVPWLQAAVLFVLLAVAFRRADLLATFSGFALLPIGLRHALRAMRTGTFSTAGFTTEILLLAVPVTQPIVLIPSGLARQSLWTLGTGVGLLTAAATYSVWRLVREWNRDWRYDRSDDRDATRFGLRSRPAPSESGLVSV